MHVGFKGAYLQGANLQEANLREANLQEAKGLTQKQVEQAVGDYTTKLPGDLTRPTSWPSITEAAAELGVDPAELLED